MSHLAITCLASWEITKLHFHSNCPICIPLLSPDRFISLPLFYQEKCLLCSLLLFPDDLLALFLLVLLTTRTIFGHFLFIRKKWIKLVVSSRVLQLRILGLEWKVPRFKSRGFPIWGMPLRVHYFTFFLNLDYFICKTETMIAAIF